MAERLAERNKQKWAGTDWQTGGQDLRCDPGR